MTFDKTTLPRRDAGEILWPIAAVLIATIIVGGIVASVFLGTQNAQKQAVKDLARFDSCVAAGGNWVTSRSQEAQCIGVTR
ncbi:hypothetical protein [Frondihabitans sp. VKM Ac-2883]|uniref:hypothetical protein n=1 Tax=Frondihabitans sp. VKM Ac-2883 TaxID=2783823 RepID=UPI00188DC003|nr:hypothetical protein [Frondihabitans sp. VKM Ac-2883]MBF4574693.1 hypothetical protein [Frondihabitans sp. VKM Ac-2883]